MKLTRNVNLLNVGIITGMDAVRNPYAPGAGTPPPELVGRDELRERARVAIQRLRLGKAEKSVLMVGLRGVGKTVLLDDIRETAEALGIHTLRVEAPENRSLPALLAPQLRLALLQLSHVEHAKESAKKGLRALAGFAKALKVKYADIEVGLDFDPEPGLADNGDLEQDLAALLETVGLAAQKADSACVLFVDELQYVAEEQLAALISGLHRCAQRSLPIGLLGAGLPQLVGRMGKAKSYAERLFDFPEIGPLPSQEAALAITKPAEKEGVEITSDAVAAIVKETRGYPYFLQEWGKHAWNAASTSPIALSDVRVASVSAIAALDASFFRVRFDRLTPAEKKYLRAMAELGPGPHRSGAIADCLQRDVTSLGVMRNKIIAKGMIFSPNHGDTAFTVPLFDEYMRRIMPGDDWRGPH
jgi:hypothetical protein